MLNKNFFFEIHVVMVCVQNEIICFQESEDSHKFRMNKERGIILVDAALYIDTEDYNITVIATDIGLHPMSAQAIVYIDMLRNINSPIFFSNNSQTVSGYADIGHRVVAVRASDDDLPNSPSGQLTYELADGLTILILVC